MPTREEAIRWAIRNNRCTINRGRAMLEFPPIKDGDMLFSEKFADVVFITLDEARAKDQERKDATVGYTPPS